MITYRDTITLEKVKLKISFHQLQILLDLKSLSKERKQNTISLFIILEKSVTFMSHYTFYMTNFSKTTYNQ